MISCPNCTKENQDHYKFCLGCGSELPRDAAPRKVGGTPSAAPGGRASLLDESTSQGVNLGSAALAPTPEPAPPPPAQHVCPQCSHENAPNNKFCAACGFKLARPAAAVVPGAVVPAAVVPAAVVPAAVVPAAAAPAAPVAPQTGGLTLTALRADGSEAGTHHVGPGPVTLGRDTDAIFAGDSYLSPQHATFSVRGGLVYVRDEGSLNGVYRRILRDEPYELAYGDIFRIGQEIIRVEPLEAPPKSTDGVERLGSPARGFVGRIALVVGRNSTGNAYPIPETGLHLGRERGDVLFPEDGYVSGLHCRIGVTNGKLHLTDLGSSNGSFLRIQRETPVKSGDILLMGQQLFRVTVQS